MKELLFIILSWVFFVSTIVMTLLYIKTNKGGKAVTKFSIVMVEAFANTVDYTLCNADTDYWNISRTSCKKFTDLFISDTQTLRENFGMKTEYYYIWK